MQKYVVQASNSEASHGSELNFQLLMLAVAGPLLRYLLQTHTVASAHALSMYLVHPFHTILEYRLSAVGVHTKPVNPLSATWYVHFPSHCRLKFTPFAKARNNSIVNVLQSRNKSCVKSRIIQS